MLPVMKMENMLVFVDDVNDVARVRNTDPESTYSEFDDASSGESGEHVSIS